MSTNTAILIALAGYTALMLGISVYWMLKVKVPEDFFMAQRDVGTVSLTGTVLATGIGTGVTLGASGLAYESGWGGVVYPIGQGIGIALLGVMFAKMRRYKFMTLSEEIACYYGGNRIIYNFANVMLFSSKIFWLSVQIVGGGFIVNLIADIPVTYGVIMSGMLMAITTIPGGLLTVVYTDVVQVVIVFAGFIGLTVAMLTDFGGFSGLTSQVPSSYSSFMGVEELGWKSVIAIPLAVMLSRIADTNNRHRIYSATSERTVERGMYAAGIFEILLSVLIVVAGMSAYAMNPELSVQDQAVPWLVMEVFPTWLAALVVVAICGAILSSGDSDAAVSATFFVRHIFPMATGRSAENPLRVGRIALVFIFIVSTTFALTAENIVDYVVNFLSVVLSGMAVLILLGRFWEKATWQGAVTAIVLGAVVSGLVMLIPSQQEFWERPILPATLAAFFGEVLVSLYTYTGDKPSFEEVSEIMSQERQKHGLEEIAVGEQIEEKVASTTQS